jgi:D-alanyl-D-alanine carboxypeptidase (penicillin-binding protein 5/6)
MEILNGVKCIDNTKKDKQAKRCGMIALFCLFVLFISGCERKSFTLTDTYTQYYETTREDEDSQIEGMASDLAVLPENEETDPTYQSNNYAELSINDTTNEVVESYRCFEKIYPASITKIMTALLTLEHGNLDDTITLEHDIVVSEDGAVVSTLSKGDTVQVGQVFHEMLIKSANDCADILAEYIAGSKEDFVDMMNAKAKELGATHTHFANTNGLHADNHYTTAYDLYLIFKEAVKYDTFVDTVSMKDYTMTYVNAQGQEVREYMQSTNYYLLNEYPTPEGVTMYGGKTGTTSMAGSCLIVMTENAQGERFFSVVLGADTKDELYQSMSDLLEKTVN